MRLANFIRFMVTVSVVVLPPCFIAAPFVPTTPATPPEIFVFVFVCVLAFTAWLTALSAYESYVIANHNGGNNTAGDDKDYL